MNARQYNEVVARINILIPETTEQPELVGQLVNDAAAFVLAYCQRETMPDGLLGAVGDVAIIAYNRRGTEGESARNEGGASLTFDSTPAHIYDIMKRYRLARAGGATHETSNS